MTLKNIKLIIWDLDETFWTGILSEGSITPVESNVSFLKDTTDMGIINSVCSKNDFTIAKNELRKINVFDLIVFPSIDWSPKGKRIERIIKSMKLRNENVLFIDDNFQNLKEAEYYCNGIQVILPTELDSLKAEAQISEKKDYEHKRLRQYQVLELKEQESKMFQSNEEFLLASQIVVKISKQCINEIDRIYELMMRSNQLNYTKNKQSKEDLIELLKDDTANCAYISVSDKYGDYGIVGFYAIKNDEAIHFLFSCRTLGIQVEQYVYRYLGYPNVKTIGDVASPLDKNANPHWINRNVKTSSDIYQNISLNTDCNVLLKGPCDMSQMYAFFNSNSKIETEFTYTYDDGVQNEGYNHTAQINTAVNFSSSELKDMTNGIDFLKPEMFTTALSEKMYNVVVLSMLTDGNLGVYKHKKNGGMIALCKKEYPITSAEFEEKYLRYEVFTSGITFTDENIKAFNEQYEYVNNFNFDITMQCLEKLHCYLDNNTVLVLLLGSEKEFHKKCDSSYAQRHIEHQLLNAKIKKWAENKPNVRIVCYDNYIESDNDVLDTINHFSKVVYYKLAIDLAKIINEKTNVNVKLKSKCYLFITSVLQRVLMILYRIKDKLFK